MRQYSLHRKKDAGNQTEYFIKMSDQTNYLIEIVVGSSSDRVQEHQILEI